MIVTEFNVLNNLTKKLIRDKEDALSMMISCPVENTLQITHFKAIYQYTETLIDELQEYAKNLEDPNFDEATLVNFFAEKP
jgi:hypothetical protein